LKIAIYKNKKGCEPFNQWLYDLDKSVIFRIRDRIDRIEEYGFLGDFKRLNEKIYELRFHFGAGYRIYFSQYKEKIVLLCAGDKSSQSADIIKAKQYLEDYENI
jgi:putative addiction module killer protein